MTLLRDIVMSGRVRLDPSRNNFPVTLHDPCNMARLMGVVEPQREIVRRICPQFREMALHGVDNYCCGRGSGFAIMSGNNFPNWPFHIRAYLLAFFVRDRDSIHGETIRRQV